MPMDYSPEQRDLIRRMGALSREMDLMAARNLRAHSTAVEALTAALNHSAEMHKLCTQHGDLFREFLDTLL